MIDQSKVKPYFARAYPPSSDTLPLRCGTFVLISHLVTVYICNDLVTNCFLGTSLRTDL
jgi:hypothetical protein